MELFGEEIYDVAVSFETLHHYTAEKKLKVFQKLWKCLKKGGCYLEADYVADEHECNLLREAGFSQIEVFYIEDGDGTPIIQAIKG